LRFDKVATRVLDRLQTNLADAVPEATIVLVTITAPIRVPAKTAAELEERIRHAPRERDMKATIHGNRVHIRFVTHQWRRAPKVIGFVHNDEKDAPQLLNTAAALMEQLTRRRRSVRAPDASWLPIYRYVFSQLGIENVEVTFENPGAIAS
jgi:hypothetical protein